METLDHILESVEEYALDLDHWPSQAVGREHEAVWPFPVVNGEQTQASIRLMQSKHRASPADDFSDFEEAVW